MNYVIYMLFKVVLSGGKNLCKLSCIYVFLTCGFCFQSLESTFPSYYFLFYPQALKKAQEGLATESEGKQFKDSNLIMQLLRDNLSVRNSRSTSAVP